MITGLSPEWLKISIGEKYKRSHLGSLMDLEVEIKLEASLNV